MRDLLAGTLILVGALLVMPATLAAWERHVIMDRDSFIALGDEVLARPEVQRALVERITADAVAFDSRLPADATRLVALRVVSRLPNSALADEALGGTHALLTRVLRSESLSAQGDTIVFDMRSVVEQLVGGQILERLSLRVSVLPEDAGRIVIVQDRDLTQVFRAGRLFDEWAPVVILAPFIVFGAALLVARRRSMALAGAGVLTLASVALALFIFDVALRGAIVDGVLLQPAAKGAAIATYDELATSLRSIQFIAGGIGIAMIVAGILGAALSGGASEGEVSSV